MGYKNKLNYNLSSINGLRGYSYSVSQPKWEINRFFTGWLSSSRRFVLPKKLAERDYCVKQGVKIQAKKTYFHRFAVLATGLLSALPIWWLSNSNASYSPVETIENRMALPIIQAEKTISTSPTQKLVETDPILPAFVPPSDIPIPPNSPWLHIRVRKGDNLSSIFERYGLSRADMFSILSLKKYKSYLTKNLHPKQKLNIKRDREGNVEEIQTNLSFTKALRIKKQDNQFIGNIEKREIETKVVSAHGKVKGSLFASGQDVGLSDHIISELVKVFRWDVDFKPFQPNDYFSVIYEEQSNGSETRAGDILAAEIINDGKIYRTIRYTNQEGKTDYYKPDGKPLFKKIAVEIEVEVKVTEVKKRNSFIRPVKNSRLSSGYGMRRHPILRKSRFHSGVDYAAPKGTSIMSTAAGKVKFVGYQRGYGKTVIVSHVKGYETLYAHMSNYAKGLKKGHKVSQGQVIGYVGSTGLSTGNHLHYEVRLDGEHQNPLRAALPDSRVKVVKEIKKEVKKEVKENIAKKHFAKQTQDLIKELDVMAEAAGVKAPQSLAQLAGASEKEATK